MSWTQFIDNPASLFSLYESEPSLESVHLSRIECSDDRGRYVEIAFSITEMPVRNQPRRWSPKSNRVVILLNLYGVSQFLVHQWPVGKETCVSAKRDVSGDVLLTFQRKGNVLASIACDSLFVARIAGYQVDDTIED